MSYRLIYTEQAENDLRDIAFRIAQDDANTAIKFVEQIRNDARLLTDNPEMGFIARFAPARKRGIRVLVIDRYILQYIANREEESVYVIKIAYGTQSYRKLFDIKP